MSFFGKNASFQDSTSNFEVAESGTYTCRLIEVELSEQPDFNDPSVMKPNFIFKFETTDHLDSQDRPFRFTKYTGRSYGNEKAGLTILINQMMGRALTKAEFANLDLEELMEKPWRVMVDEHTTAAGKLVNKIMSVRPVQRKGVVVDAVLDKPAHKKPLARTGSEDVEDPFA